MSAWLTTLGNKITILETSVAAAQKASTFGMKDAVARVLRDAQAVQIATHAAISDLDHRVATLEGRRDG